MKWIFDATDVVLVNVGLRLENLVEIELGRLVDKLSPMKLLSGSLSLLSC